MGTIAILAAIAAFLLLVIAIWVNESGGDAEALGFFCFVFVVIGIVFGSLFGAYKSDAKDTENSISQSLAQQGYYVQRVYAVNGIWHAQVTLQQNQSCSGDLTVVPVRSPYSSSLTANIVNVPTCANASAAKPLTNNDPNTDDSNASGLG